MSELELPHGLLSHVHEGRVLLLLGAGAAVGATHPDGAKVPLGGELADMLAAQFLGKGYTGKPLQYVAELAISEHNLVAVQSFIDDKFRLFGPAAFHRSLAELPWRAIFTTNYDLILEKAYENPKAVQELVVFTHDGQHVDDRISSRRCVQYVKLHGCITRITDENLPLILTTDQYVTHRSGRNRLFDRLQELAYEYPILFVGHSLADPDIRAILLELEKRGSARPRSYAVVPRMTDAERRYWEGRRVTPIQATLEELVASVISSAPAGVFKAVPDAVVVDHPINKHLRTNEPLSNAVLTFLEEACDFVHAGIPIDTSSPKEFYRGYTGGWSPIARGLDVARSLNDRMLEQVILPDEDQRESQQELYIITGHAGAGKSVSLRRLAWDAAGEYERICLFLDRGGDFDFELLDEIHRATGKRLFLFLDGATNRRDLILGLLRQAQSERVPLTIVTAERNHSLNTRGETLLAESNATYQLHYLTQDEIESLLERLERFGALERLETKTPEERVHAFREVAGRQLLVALHEATLGKPFEEILADEYRSISSPRAQEIYRTVAVIHRLGVPVRAGLIARVHQLSFTDFKERFFAPLERIVFFRKDRLLRDAVYETRHPLIAEMVFEQVLVDERDRYDEYVRVLSALDVDFTCDREALRGLSRARSLEKLFPSKPLALGIVQVAKERAPEDARLLQQEAIVHMKWNPLDLDEAEDALKRAVTLAPWDQPIRHSLVELLVKRAELTPRNLSMRLRQRLCVFYEGYAWLAELGVSCRGVLAAARYAT